MRLTQYQGQSGHVVKLDIHSLRIETTYRIGSADRIASPSGSALWARRSRESKGIAVHQKTPTQSPVGNVLGFKLEWPGLRNRVNISSNWSNISVINGNTFC